MGHTNRRLENNAVDTNVDYDSLAQEVSEEKNFSMLPRDCSCNILVKNVAAFCPCLNSLPEAKVKSFGLIPLAEETSKQPRLSPVVISDNSNEDL
ncbi:hypothetical protein ACQP3C_26175 [Escherichia coli]